MTIGELVFNLSFKSDTMKLKDFGKAVSELNMSSILTAGSFGALYEGAKALVGIADDMALGINKFGRETGQSREEIQKWSLAAEEMGVAPEAMAASIGGLEDQIFKMRMTGEGSGIWALIGIDPTKTQSMFQILDMVREKLKGLSTDRQRFLLEQLGLGTQWLNMFSLSDQAWADIEKNQALSNDQLDTMQEYHAALVRDGKSLKMIFADLGVAIAPALQGIADMLNNFDLVVLKSWEFKGALDTIAEIASNIAKDLLYIQHPENILKDVGKTFKMAANQYQDWGLENKTKANRWAETLLPGTSFGKGRDYVPAPVNVNVKVNKAGPETTVETTSDQGQLNSAVKNVVNQKPPGQG